MNKWMLIKSAAAAALLLPSMSHAITVLGVTWDETHPLDLSIESLGLRETSVGSVGDVLSGFGQVGSINDSSTFCSGCELTFHFDNFVVSAIQGNQVLFTGGTVSFYVDNSPNFTRGNVNSATDGELWLQLAGHALDWDLGTGTLFGTFQGPLDAPTSGSLGNAYFDAVGGPAAPYVNTNGLLGGSDFHFTSSFQVEAGCLEGSPGPCFNPDYPIFGTGELQGNSTIPVPEPSALALVGFGLLGFAFAGRRKFN